MRVAPLDASGPWTDCCADCWADSARLVARLNTSVARGSYSLTAGMAPAGGALGALGALGPLANTSIKLTNVKVVICSATSSAAPKFFFVRRISLLIFLEEVSGGNWGR